MLVWHTLKCMLYFVYGRMSNAARQNRNALFQACGTLASQLIHSCKRHEAVFRLQCHARICFENLHPKSLTLGERPVERWNALTRASTKPDSWKGLPRLNVLCKAVVFQRQFQPNKHLENDPPFSVHWRGMYTKKLQSSRIQLSMCLWYLGSHVVAKYMKRYTRIVAWVAVMALA